MKAAVNRTYGPAEKVIRIEEVPRPEVGDDEVLVKVYATSVSTGAWRMLEMNAGGVLQLAARLIFGIFGPRKPIQGGSFSGRVVRVGRSVTRFSEGDDVFGVASAGAHAEYIAISQDKAIVTKPTRLGHDEAAALPFGGLSALVFLRDLAKVRAGQKVLVTGASGGVGVFAVQIAKHFGAEVTGLTSTGNVDLVRSLAPTTSSTTGKTTSHWGGRNTTSSSTLQGFRASGRPQMFSSRADYSSRLSSVCLT